VDDVKGALLAASPSDIDQPFYRMCNLNDPRIAIEPLPISPAQKAFLYRSTGFRSKPSDVDLIKRHVDEVFARPLAKRKDRYSRSRPALYTCAQVPTAEAEIRYYARTHFYNPTLNAEPMSFNVIEVSFAGLAIDVPQLYRRFPTLRARLEPDKAHELGDSAADLVGCILVRSVRARGLNGVLFWPLEIQAVGRHDDLNIKIYKRKGGRFTRKI
jgi:RES domain-containing protein